jgi:hypothetical protein
MLEGCSRMAQRGGAGRQNLVGSLSKVAEVRVEGVGGVGMVGAVGAEFEMGEMGEGEDGRRRHVLEELQVPVV